MKKLTKKAEALLNAIEAKEKEFNENAALFGHGEFMTSWAFHELLGLQQAFEIVTGFTVTEYKAAVD
jgi:hypothetical protein